MSDPSLFTQWLDETLGPPFSGAVVLTMIGALSLLSSWVAIRTLNHIFRDK